MSLRDRCPSFDVAVETLDGGLREDQRSDMHLYARRQSDLLEAGITHRPTLDAPGIAIRRTAQDLWPLISRRSQIHACAASPQASDRTETRGRRGELNVGPKRTTATTSGVPTAAQQNSLIELDVGAAG